MTLLIVGLGNPGIKYQGTRHNTGFNVVDKMALKLGVKLKKSFFNPYQIAKSKFGNHKYILVKPLTYMNNSGAIIPGLLSKYNLTNSNLVIVVDNLDISKGQLKFKVKGSDGGHNGLKSINEYLGTVEYKRVFVGIGRPEKGEPIVDYVLSPIEDSSVFDAEDRAVKGLFNLPDNEISQIMNFLNRRVSESRSH